MIKIQIRHRFSGKLLFELEKENNSIKITLEAAASIRANLSRANLSRADLYGANLSGADLYGANLSRADLSRANLSGADLYGANLSGADLSRANLSGADLYGANLSRADLYGANLYEIKNPPVNDHQFASEILYRRAKTESQKDFAARVRLETNQCWAFFIKLARKKKVVVWVKEVLGKWNEYREKWERDK